MTFEDHAARRWMCVDEALQPDAKLEARPSPGDPADRLAEDLAGDCLTILARGDSDDRIRMDVVDMRTVDQRMNGRVDAGRAPIQAESTMGIEGDDLVLHRRSLVAPGDLAEAVHAQCGEAITPDGAEIPAGPLDQHDIDRSSRQRIGQAHLRGSVAAAEIRDALVRTEQIGPVNKEIRGRERRSPRIVPQGRQAVGRRLPTVLVRQADVPLPCSFP